VAPQDLARAQPRLGRRAAVFGGRESSSLTAHWRAMARHCAPGVPQRSFCERRRQSKAAILAEFPNQARHVR
jgi:hypothetical protein